MNRSHQPKFAVDDCVRVRAGVTDFDYADMPLGGWAGVVVDTEADGGSICLVRWSRETLALVSELYRDRCEEDGVDFREKWIDAEDLVLDPGGSVWIEQPDRPAGQPVKALADRLRGVFGLEGTDTLPRVDEGSLGVYYEHLFARLSLPFPGAWWQDCQRFTKGPRSVVVLRLLDKSLLNGTDGIFCEVHDEEGRWKLPLHRLQVDPGDPNYPWIDDYRCWFTNCGQ